MDKKISDSSKYYQKRKEELRLDRISKKPEPSPLINITVLEPYLLSCYYESDEPTITPVLNRMIDSYLNS